MRNLFIRVILAFTLSASILSCAFNLFIEKPPEPQKQVLEAPIVQSIRAWIAWFSGGGGGGRGSGGYWRFRYLPSPEG